jgi:hypothetical protein
VVRQSLKGNITTYKELRLTTKGIITSTKGVRQYAKGIIAPQKGLGASVKGIRTSVKVSGATIQASTFAAHCQGKNQKQPCQRAASSKTSTVETLLGRLPTE